MWKLQPRFLSFNSFQHFCYKNHKHLLWARILNGNKNINNSQTSHIIGVRGEKPFVSYRTYCILYIRFLKRRLPALERGVICSYHQGVDHGQAIRHLNWGPPKLLYGPHMGPSQQGPEGIAPITSVLKAAVVISCIHGSAMQCLGRPVFPMEHAIFNPRRI